MIEDPIRCWSQCRCRGRTGVGVVAVERHVAEEVVDIDVEVLVGEDVLLVGVHDEGQ
jgi:hypothetical protein